MFFNNNSCCMNEQDNSCSQMDRCGCNPIIEQPIERCIERNICHRVEQV